MVPFLGISALAVKEDENGAKASRPNSVLGVLVILIISTLLLLVLQGPARYRCFCDTCQESWSKVSHGPVFALSTVRGHWQAQDAKHGKTRTSVKWTQVTAAPTGPVGQEVIHAAAENAAAENPGEQTVDGDLEAPPPLPARFAGNTGIRGW